MVSLSLSLSLDARFSSESGNFFNENSFGKKAVRVGEFLYLSPSVFLFLSFSLGMSLSYDARFSSESCNFFNESTFGEKAVRMGEY